MEEEKKICPVCGTEVPSSYNHDRYLTFYRCPVCGQYQLDVYWKEQGFNMNHLAAFLAHNAYHASDFEQRYYTTASREVCDELQKEGKGHPVHIDSEIVEAWYPRSFAEKIDLILLYLHKHAPHIGQSIHFTPQTLYSFLFIDRYDFVNGQYVSRKDDTLDVEAMGNTHKEVFPIGSATA